MSRTIRTPGRGVTVEATWSGGTPNAAGLKKRSRSAGRRPGAAPDEAVVEAELAVKLNGGSPLACDATSSAALTVSPWPPGSTLRKPPGVLLGQGRGRRQRQRGGERDERRRSHEGSIARIGPFRTGAVDGTPAVRWDRPVTKYDAFGREIGKDPLESLGWRDEPPTMPVETAVAEEAPAPAEAAPSAPVTPPVFVRRGPRRRGRGGRGSLLAVVVVLGAVGLFAGSSGQDLGEVIPDVDVDVNVPEISRAAPERPPRGLEAGSLLRRAEFAAALARLRAEKLGRLTFVRIAPERIDARLLSSGGRLRNVQVRHDGEFRDFGASAGGFGFVATVPFARVDPAVPARLTRAAARRLRLSPARLDYLVVTAAGGEIRWGAYFKGGQYLLADADGRIVRRVS